MAKKVGISLSCCIQDLIEGRVSLYEVSGIYCNTHIHNFHDWVDCMRKYCDLYWRRDPVYAICLCAHLSATGRLFQRPHYHTGGNWVGCTNDIVWTEEDSALLPMPSFAPHVEDNWHGN